jgi:SRSO17 transposase
MQIPISLHLPSVPYLPPRPESAYDAIAVVVQPAPYTFPYLQSYNSQAEQYRKLLAFRQNSGNAAWRVFDAPYILSAEEVGSRVSISSDR